MTNEITSGYKEFVATTLEEAKQVESFRLGIWLIKLITVTFLVSTIVVCTTIGYVEYAVKGLTDTTFLMSVIQDLLKIITTIVSQ